MCFKVVSHVIATKEINKTNCFVLSVIDVMLAHPFEVLYDTRRYHKTFWAIFIPSFHNTSGTGEKIPEINGF